jgi:hypothetical protein
LKPLLTRTCWTEDRGIWYRHRDGSTVHQRTPGGHVWAKASLMSSICIFCSVIWQQAEEPSTESCPLITALVNGDP